jgi:hypothetical protein
VPFRARYSREAQAKGDRSISALGLGGDVRAIYLISARLGTFLKAVV